MPTQLQLPLFPLNQCGRSTAPCPLTLHSSAIVCSVCGCTAPIRLANPCEQLMRADPFQNDEGLSRPDSAAGKLQRVLLKLLREHERDDALPTNGRFLFYELIGLKVVSKQKKSKGRRSDQNMHDALTHLRDKGIVPWSWIADETRSLVDYTGVAHDRGLGHDDG